MSGKIPIAKTYKLFINGAFPRSESGRTFSVDNPEGELIANVSQASRKDFREAVRAARSAQSPWASRTAYNRGQILYRVAEMLESRKIEFVELLKNIGLNSKAAKSEVEEAIHRWVWYAGWSDKYSQVLGSVNPVSGPYFNFTVPEPTGVVGIIAPAEPSMMGLVSRLAPAIVSGNTVVVVSQGQSSLTSITIGEVLATSDVPEGVVNILTGDQSELLPWMIGHMDVNAVDISGISPETDHTLLEEASLNVKRVVSRKVEEESLELISDFLEMKTIWHPVGR
ncbi:MAG: aldehyde dehydrogenase family protein [Acidimicrobiales bacterium]|nr:MAG: aldehyde dehydrogenase [marine actinobacterium MedAcidi-G1]MAU34407.1 aldehyde dehydrogenase [Actinomycetota bacterium]HAQ04318.1 aldehyde dehydrogenase [Acidimicrobiaceae bacterium]